MTGRATGNRVCSAPKCRSKAVYLWKDGKSAYCGECFSAAIGYRNVQTRVVGS